MATTPRAVWVKDEEHLARVEVEELDEERVRVTIVDTVETAPWRCPLPSGAFAVPRAELRDIDAGGWKSLKRVAGKALKGEATVDLEAEMVRVTGDGGTANDGSPESGDRRTADGKADGDDTADGDGGTAGDRSPESGDDGEADGDGKGE